VPLADLSPPGPVIELVEAEPKTEPNFEPKIESKIEAVSVAPAPAEPAPHPVDEDTPAQDAPVATVEREEVLLPAVVPRRPVAADPHLADSVIPLVHSPDDPGPDGDLADEPTPEPPAQEGWWRRRKSLR
jgi:HemY protein